MRLLPDVILEHHKIRSARVAARRGADLYSEPQDGGDAPVAPTAAREIDPTLPDHWNRLLVIFGLHDAAHGAQQLLGTARRELRLITEYRQVARGELRVAFMHVEARWAALRRPGCARTPGTRAAGPRCWTEPATWRARPISPT